MMTITENVESFFEYAEESRLHTQIPGACRKQLRALYKSAFQLVL